MLRVYVAYRGSAIVTFLLGSFFAKIANRIFYVPFRMGMSGSASFRRGEIRTVARICYGSCSSRE